MKCVTLVCSECKKEFEKPQNEYNRRVKKGVEKFYCSISCSATYANKEQLKGFAADRTLSGRGKVWSPDDLSPFRWYMRRCKNRQNKKGETNLTDVCLKDLWETQKGICPLTGWQLKLPRGTAGWTKEEPFTSRSASLDRIDNSKGYVTGNVRFIAVMANYARNTFADEDVIEFAEAIVSNKIRAINGFDGE